MKNIRKIVFIGIILQFIVIPIYSQSNDLNPGIDRWSIKTSLPQKLKKKILTLDQLLSLKDPIDTYKSNPYDTIRIPGKVANGLKEGDIITVTGWLHLVAIEKDANHHRDGDYHIQIRNSSVWSDSCLIVEVAFPDPRFVKDSGLANSCANVREFIRTNMLKGKEPGTSGNKMTHPCHVTITGQLFFDAVHLGASKKGTYRGKQGMKSYTCWEIHPVTSIKFAQK
jgi:hypothetical protein